MSAAAGEGRTAASRARQADALAENAGILSGPDSLLEASALGAGRDRLAEGYAAVSRLASLSFPRGRVLGWREQLRQSLRRPPYAGFLPLEGTAVGRCGEAFRTSGGNRGRGLLRSARGAAPFPEPGLFRGEGCPLQGPTCARRIGAGNIQGGEAVRASPPGKFRRRRAWTGSSGRCTGRPYTRACCRRPLRR